MKSLLVVLQVTEVTQSRPNSEADTGSSGCPYQRDIREVDPSN